MISVFETVTMELIGRFPKGSVSSPAMIVSRWVAPSMLVVLLQAACAASTSVPMDAMGTNTTTATHTPRPAEKTAVSMEECNGGTLEGCHAAALDAYYSPPSADNDARALALFKKACDGGYAPSCNGLGVLHQEGRGVVKDPGIAAMLFRRACASDGSTGCQHLAQALRTGKGVPKDADAAERAEARGKCLFEVSLKKDGRTCPPLDADR